MYLCLCSVYIAHSDRDSELFPGTTDVEVSEAVLKKSLIKIDFITSYLIKTKLTHKWAIPLLVPHRFICTPSGNKQWPHISLKVGCLSLHQYGQKTRVCSDFFISHSLTSSVETDLSSCLTESLLNSNRVLIFALFTREEPRWDLL